MEFIKLSSESDWCLRYKKQDVDNKKCQNLLEILKFQLMWISEHQKTSIIF